MRGERHVGILRAYARLILFTAGVLVGVQVPSFVDQYFKRVSAHQLEALTNFRGYERTAADHFQGDVHALLGHYQGSADPVFRADARNIEAIFSRIGRYTEELETLNSPLVHRIVHVVLFSDREIVRETMNEYSYTVPLNQGAILCGLVLGLFAAVLFETLLLGLAGLTVLGWRGVARKSAVRSSA
jgi:F0F1-type ATP synthase assembly protein I